MAQLLGIYEKLYNLKQNEGFDLVEMQHGWRLNGQIDLWKRDFVTYEICKNKYLQHRSAENAFDYAVKMARILGHREAFKKTKKGRMTYQEFKHRKVSMVIEPEYEVWKTVEHQSSESDLYFILNEVGELKIGSSKIVKSRKSTLATGSATDLSILLVVKNKGFAEHKIRNCFSQLKMNGEWIVYCDRVQRFIDFIKSQDPSIERPLPEKIQKEIRFKTPRQLPEKPIGKTKMPFGKYKGVLLSEIPIGYCEWAARELSDAKLREYFQSRVAQPSAPINHQINNQ